MKRLLILLVLLVGCGVDDPCPKGPCGPKPLPSPHPIGLVDAGVDAR